MRMVIGEISTLYANPAPLLFSRQAAFPGLSRLPSGDIIALFSIGQAFDAADMRAHVSRSSDDGRTWSPPAPMHRAGADLESESFKPLALSDGTLIATGYCFVRPDMETPIVDPETLDVLPMRNRISVSTDAGRSWSAPRRFSVENAPLELSGPAIETSSGRLLAAAAPFHLGPNNHEGWIIASDDKGESWFRLSVFFRSGSGAVAPWECRLAELGLNRIAVLFWAYDNQSQRNLANHLVLSADGGESFGPAIDTGIQAQASNLLPLGPDRLLTIHAHREPPVGLVLREITLDADGIRIEREQAIFSGDVMASTSGDIAGQFGSLKFGQPSLLRLDDTTALAAWWQLENCQHVIKTCRIGLET